MRRSLIANREDDEYQASIAETIAALKAMGHKVTVLPGWGSLGHMQAIRVDPKTGTMMAGGDPRRTAYAMGY